MAGRWMRWAPPKDLENRGTAARMPCGMNGFTLIEMMAVVVIAGIIAALAMPNLMGIFRGSQVSSAMRELYAGFQEAQSQARITGARHCLELDRAGKRWRLLFDSTGNGVCNEEIRVVVLSSEHVTFGPTTGFPEPFAVPYQSVPRHSWCTACGQDVGVIAFDRDGTMTSVTSGTDFTSASIMLYDESQTSSRIEAMVMMGPTGDARLFRWD